MVLLLWRFLPLIAMGMFKLIWWGLDPGSLARSSRGIIQLDHPPVFIFLETHNSEPAGVLFLAPDSPPFTSHSHQ